MRERISVFSEYGATEDKNDCAYIMLYDAIKKGRVVYFNAAHYLRNHKKAMNYYIRLCGANSKALDIFRGDFLPNLRKNKKYIIYVNENNIVLKDRFFFRRLKQRYDVFSVLVFRNMFRNKLYPGCQGIMLSDLRKEFDLIVTDEYDDAQKYDLFYVPDSFSNVCKKNLSMENDLVFVGNDKGRRNLILDIKKAAEDNGIKSDFRITGSKKNLVVDYVEYLPYTEIIEADLKSNCILELLQPGQKSFTLRTQEAICLGRKLLTNNKNIANEEFYDPRYIEIFEKVEDIDWNFVKDRDEVDYSNYVEDFSPIVFFDKIESELKKRKV